MTAHQQFHFDKILNNSSKVVTLLGEGGTGKTYTISKFLKTLPSSTRVMLTTTTHQSLSILREMIPDSYDCDIESKTIHSYLGFVVYDNEGKTTLRRNHKIDIEFVDYLIVDEWSYLTKQLFDFLKSEEMNIKVRKKIILVGDKMQLRLDDFLDMESVDGSELTENMRQDETSGLYKFCSSLRGRIEKKLGPISIPANNEDIFMTSNHTEFIDRYKTSVENKCIIAFRNNTIKTYNTNIKKKMLRENVYTVKDSLIVLEPVFKHLNGGHSIVFPNRERVVVDEIIKEDNDVITLLVHNSKMVYCEINVPKNKTNHNKMLKSFVDKKDWKNYYRLKETHNFVHHDYALTVYSAQGSTFDEVYIDLSDFTPPNDPTNDKLMRMVYVALTRAKKRVYVYLSDGSARNYDAFGTSSVSIDID